MTRTFVKVRLPSGDAQATPLAFLYLYEERYKTTGLCSLMQSTGLC